MLVGTPLLTSPISPPTFIPPLRKQNKLIIQKQTILEKWSTLFLLQMKIFSWIRGKRSGNEPIINKPIPQPIFCDVMHESCKEEFSDWPSGLLAIGTFGNHKIQPKHSDKADGGDDDDLQQRMERELRVAMSEEQVSLDKENLSVEHLLDCLRRRGGARLESQISLVGRSDIQSDKRNRGGIGKSSLSFLIKKALLCGGGFAAGPPSPTVRDPLPNCKLDRSTMEKILRAMLQKKIHPQRPNTPKRFLDMAESESDDEQESGKGSHESKWVKTDSEYIVLEI